MKDVFFLKEEVITIDLLKFRVWEAMQYLNNTILVASPKIKEIVVIHGYHNGNVLLNMVRNEYRNSRVKSKFISLNPGITSLILK